MANQDVRVSSLKVQDVVQIESDQFDDNLGSPKKSGNEVTIVTTRATFVSIISVPAHFDPEEE